MNKEMYIVDTTLRDGAQSPGEQISIKNKFEIVNYLESKGVYQIEAGIPAMGDVEKEFIKEILSNKNKSKISTWNRININDIKESLDCKPDIIHLSVPTSDIQIFTKLNKSKNWVVESMLKSVYFAKEHNYDVTVGFEDASRTEVNFLIELCEKLYEFNVNTVRYADTLGILTPTSTYNAITKLRRSSQVNIEIHAHNDFGMAIANSVEAVKAGAKYVNCTIDGKGERAGNCNMQELINITKEFFVLK